MNVESNDVVELLMVRCLERPEVEWPMALDEAAKAHPEHAHELRERVRLLARLHDHVPNDESGSSDAFVPRDIDEFTGLTPIGRGGMGIVYRAHQSSLNRDVAIKVIRPERLLYDGAAERFRREVETVAQLRSPNIVSIHSVGESVQGEVRLPYFAMELLEGATLAQVVAAVAQRTPESLTGADLFRIVAKRKEDEVGEGQARADLFDMTWVEACLRVTREAARALEHAHARGVLHRDVKPGNIMLEPSGRVVLFDFGLTATGEPSSKRLTASGHPVGTLVYMAPEQLESSVRLDARADVYALGVTLYELLTLQVPFDADSVLELSRAIEAARPGAIRARNRRVSADIQTVCQTAMARRPGDRYANTRSFAEDIENVLAGRAIHARPPSAPKRLLRGAPRKPAKATAAMLSAVIVVGGPTALFVTERAHAIELATTAAAEKEAKEDALAANDELEDVLAFTLDLFAQAAPNKHGGDIPNAVEMLHAGAAKLAELNSRPKSKARIDLALGHLFDIMTDLNAAKPHLEAAIAHFESVDDWESRQRLASTLRLAAHNAAFRGDSGRALVLIDRACNLADEVLPESDIRRVGYDATLADVLMMSRDYQGAVEARERALAIMEALGGESESTRLIELRGLLGCTLREAGEHERARPLLESAIEQLDKLDDTTSGSLQTFQIELSALKRLEGEPRMALELAKTAYDTLKVRNGDANLMTLQALLCRAQAHAILGESEVAASLAASAAAGLREQIQLTHPVLVTAHSFLIGAWTSIGNNRAVIDLCDEHDLLTVIGDANGQTSDAHRKAHRAYGLGAQALGLHSRADSSLVALEAAERALDPWSSAHAESVLLLTSHRGKFTPTVDRSQDIALLRELIEIAGEDDFPVTSVTNGQTFEGGYLARLFLADSLGSSQSEQAEARALRIEAEARKARVTARK